MADLRTPASASPSARASSPTASAASGPISPRAKAAAWRTSGSVSETSTLPRAGAASFGLLAHAAEGVRRGVADGLMIVAERRGQLGHRGLGVGTHVAERKDGCTADQRRGILDRSADRAQRRLGRRAVVAQRQGRGVSHRHVAVAERLAQRLDRRPRHVGPVRPERDRGLAPLGGVGGLQLLQPLLDGLRRRRREAGGGSRCVFLRLCPCLTGRGQRRQQESKRESIGDLSMRRISINGSVSHQIGAVSGWGRPDQGSRWRACMPPACRPAEAWLSGAAVSARADARRRAGRRSVRRQRNGPCRDAPLA